ILRGKYRAGSGIVAGRHNHRHASLPRRREPLLEFFVRSTRLRLRGKGKGTADEIDPHTDGRSQRTPGEAPYRLTVAVTDGKRAALTVTRNTLEARTLGRDEGCRLCAMAFGTRIAVLTVQFVSIGAHEPNVPQSIDLR